MLNERRQVKKIPRSIILVVVAMIAGAGLGVGVTATVTAGADGQGTTYYACLKLGKLTSVGAIPDNCKAPATQISWNSVGPQGPAGPAGATGPQGPSGDTSAYTSSGQISSLPASLTLPTGDYIVMASANEAPQIGTTSLVCGITPDPDDLLTPGLESGQDVSWSGPLTVTSSTEVVTMSCVVEGSSQPPLNGWYSFTAISVGSINP